jgi:site-specific DNA-cytosine methylase
LSCQAADKPIQPEHEAILTPRELHLLQEFDCNQNFIKYNKNCSEVPLQFLVCPARTPDKECQDVNGC